MNAHDFRAQLFDKAGAVPAAAVRQASQEFEAIGRLNPWDVPDCLERAGSIAGAQPKLGVRRVRPGRARVTAAGLTDMIQLRVKEIRRAVFAADNPPFPEESAAVAWIEATAAAQPEATKTARRKTQRLEREIYRLLEQHARLRPDIVVGFEREVHGLLAYRKPGDAWVHHVVIRDPDGPVARLHAACVELAAATGFWPSDLAAHVLSGAPLRLPAVQVREHDKLARFEAGWIRRTWVTIELHANDVTFTEFRELFRDIRGKLQLGRRKAITDDDERFLSLVRRHGGPPPRTPNSRPFWERVRQDWNRHAEPGQKHHDYRSSALRYRRLKARAQDAMLGAAARHDIPQPGESARPRVP